MLITCKNPGCPRRGRKFRAKRASAQFCTTACRMAAHRRQHVPLPLVRWTGKVPKFAAASRSLNADGTAALSKAELAEHLIEISAAADGGEPKTGRHFYYLALSHGYISPDMGDTDAAKKSRDAAYDRVTDVLGTLRKQGRIGWDAVLDLTRDLDQWQMFGAPREARAEMRRHYDEDRWRGQTFFPILIVEKDSMEPVAKPMASRWQMPFCSSRGYGSLKLQHDTAELIKHRYARHGQSSIVYFISDFDPSGLDLQRAWEQAMQDFGVAHISEFQRIALTRQQIRDGGLERLAIAVKPNDSRSELFIERHGNQCWEVDILPPAVIRRDLSIYIENWLNRKLWDQRAAEIERARGLL